MSGLQLLFYITPIIRQTICNKKPKIQLLILIILDTKMNPSEKKIKLEHFENLLAVAYADGEFDAIELEFLTEKAEEYGISSTEVSELMKRADQLQFEIPQNLIDREDQLSDAVFMMMVDGDIGEKEYELCYQLAQKLEFKQKDLDHIIHLTKDLWEKMR